MTTRIICSVNDLVANSGVCARITVKDKPEQVALFYVPKSTQKVFALGNWDPLGEANVISRGIVGDIDDELVVASPLYKQHFSLIRGQCIEEEGVAIPSYKVSLSGDDVVFHNAETS